MTNILTSLNEIRLFLEESEHESAEFKVPAKWQAALDASTDIIEKADSLRVAVELGSKDVDMCVLGYEEDE